MISSASSPPYASKPLTGIHHAALEIEGYGTYNVSQGVISLQNDRGTSYYQYIAVQNEIVKAIDELRDEFAMSNYGRPYIRLTEDQQDIVKKAIPQRISEAEPKDVYLPLYLFPSPTC